MRQGFPIRHDHLVPVFGRPAQRDSRAQAHAERLQFSRVGRLASFERGSPGRGLEAMPFEEETLPAVGQNEPFPIGPRPV
jgi:hypothetical protein